MKSLIYFVGSAIILTLAGCGGSDSPEALLKAGNQAFESRDYAGARRYYLRGLEIDNKNRDLLLAAGKAYRQDRILDSAIYYLKRADLLQHDDREVCELIREIAPELGDWQNAIDACESLARLDGTMDPYHLELADYRLRNNQPGRAYYHARHALLSSPDVPGLYLQTSSMAARYDSVGVAIEILDQAIAKYGPMNQFVVNRAMLQALVGNYEEAEESLREVISSSEFPDPALKLNLANILASEPHRAKKEEALRIYQEIRDLIGPEFPVDSLMQALQNDLEQLK